MQYACLLFGEEVFEVGLGETLGKTFFAEDVGDGLRFALLQFPDFLLHGSRGDEAIGIDRSGLAGHFTHTAIVKEKDPEAYACLVRERNLKTERTWMVGNSPKSDINPALAAGLNAVYVPHPRTWGLEKEEIQAANGRLLILESFSDLGRHF